MGARANKLAVVAAAAAGGAFAQPGAAVAPVDPEAQLLATIDELRANEGPTPASAIEPLRALALLHQEEGDHALATVAFQEARHAIRVNLGFSSVEEALLLRELIRSEEALGNHGRVWSLEQDMVTIARQHMDDVRTLPIFRGLAEDRHDALRTYIAGDFPPEMDFGCYYAALPRRYDDTRGRRRPAADGSCRSGHRPVVIDQMRAEVLMFYADAIEVIVKNGDFSSQELRDLERQAFRVAPFRAPPCPWAPLEQTFELELVGSCLEPVIRFGTSVFANVGGWASLVRLIAYERKAGAPATTRAETLTDLADWYLLSRPAERRRFAAGSDLASYLYEYAFRQLEQDAEARSSLFAPHAPVTFATSYGGVSRPWMVDFTPRDAFSPVTTAESARYIDVSFDITKYGRGERVEVLETSSGATRAEQRELIGFIESATFRPRIVDGKVADAATVVARYPLDRGTASAR